MGYALRAGGCVFRERVAAARRGAPSWVVLRPRPAQPDLLSALPLPPDRKHHPLRSPKSNPKPGGWTSWCSWRRSEKAALAWFTRAPGRAAWPPSRCAGGAGMMAGAPARPEGLRAPAAAGGERERERERGRLTSEPPARGRPARPAAATHRSPRTAPTPCTPSPQVMYARQHERQAMKDALEMAVRKTCHASRTPLFTAGRRAPRAVVPLPSPRFAPGSRPGCHPIQTRPSRPPFRLSRPNLRC